MTTNRLEAFSDGVLAIVITSMVLYAASIPLAFVHPAISGALFGAVALMWLVPDRRMETAWTQACADTSDASRSG